MKRILICLISLLLVCNGFVFASETEKNEDSKGFGYEHKIASAEPFVFLDFNDYDDSIKSNIGFERMSSGTVYFPQMSNDWREHYFSCSGYCYPKVKFKEPINSGTYLFSFDIKRSKAENVSYLVNYTSRNYTDNNGECFYSFGQHETRIGSNNNWIIKPPKVFTANEWHHVAMFMDFDNKKIQYYINNEYAGETLFTGDNMYGFSYFVEGDAGNVTSLDNIAMYKMTPELGDELKTIGVLVPDECLYAFSVNISSEHLGNMFRTFNDVKIKVDYENRLEQDLKCDISYTAKNYMGDVVWSDTKSDVAIGAKETFSDDIHPIVDRYDIYTLYAKITPQNDLLLPTEIDREFSVVNACTPGYKNYNLGCQNHPWSVSKFEDIKYPLDVLGIGLYRTDYNVASYETSPGVYDGLADWRYDVYRQVNDMGIKNLLIWGPMYNPYGQGGSAMTIKEMSQRPEILKNLENASEAVARDLKDVVQYFELGNEYNGQRNENLSPEEYAACARAQYLGLKKGNPDCTVISQGASRCAGEFVYRYLMAPAGKSCDAVAQHIYQESGTPESKRFDLYSQYVRDAMLRANCGDMELWNTEGNTAAHYSYSTESQHGVNLVRQFVQCEAYHVNDKYFFYELQTDELSKDDIESYFGILRGKGSKNYCGPKQTYLAAANYIAMTENAEFVDDIQYDNVWIYRFKHQDGSYTLMMYADRDTKLTSLDLGAMQGKMYDVNGNCTELNSADGRFTFAICDQPVYFKYSGDKFDKTDDVVSLDKNVIELTKASKDCFNVTVPDGTVIKLSNRDNVSVAQNGNNIEIKANYLPERYKDPALGYVSETAYSERRHDFGTQLYRDFVNMTVEKDGKVIAYIPLPYEWVYDTADVSMTVEPYNSSNSKFWVGKVKVRNNSADKELSGRIVVDSPDITAQKTKPMEVENIKPGETAFVTFNIDISESTDWRVYKGRFISDDGDEIPFQLTGVPRSSDFSAPSSASIASIKKNKGDIPKIDGVIDEDEWKEYKLTDFDKSQVSYGSQNLVVAGVVEEESFGEDADYGGNSDFSGSIYAKWDDKYLYTAAIVHDDVHFQKQSSVEFYHDDCFYLTLKPTLSQRHDTRIDFALSDFYDNPAFDESDRGAKIFRNWSEMFDVCVCGLIEPSEDGFASQIIRKNNTTLYECRLPLDQIMSKKTIDDKQCYISFAIRDYDGDRDKTYAFDAWFVLTEPKK